MMARSAGAGPGEDAAQFAAVEPDAVRPALVDDDAAAYAIRPAVHHGPAGGAFAIADFVKIVGGLLGQHLVEAGVVESLRPRGFFADDGFEFTRIEEQPQAARTALDEE